MELNIKIIIVLSVVSCNIIMSMENTMYYEQPPVPTYPYALKRTLETEAERLATFACTEYITETDVTFALGTSRWLVRQRTAIPDNRIWITFVSNFTQKMEEHYCFCPCIPHKKLSAVIEAINNTIRTAKPGEDFSQLLVDRAQEEMSKAVQELNKISY